MAKKKDERSQLLDLLLHVAAELGAKADREVAELAEVSADNVANWRDGSVKELKTQTLLAFKRNLATRLAFLRQQVEHAEVAVGEGLVPIEIEENSGPSALQRQFIDRMVYDYLGHRFLYFEPQGALAWEGLIKGGYEQDCWLAGVRACVQDWLDPRRDAGGWCKGPLAESLGWDRRAAPRGLDVVSLGPGEGGKEVIVLGEILRRQGELGQRLRWLTLALVDVSIPLLLTATRDARALVRGLGQAEATPVGVLPFCADFEEGQLSFVQRLPSEAAEGRAGLRLVMVLGNVFGNVRDEESFLQQKVRRLLRPGDLLWIDVGIRPERIEHDPLFRMTDPEQAATAAFSGRRLLLEGPYRRWEAAIGRPPSELETRVWLREGDDSSRVPGSVNFCHDLVIKNERRVCTMLYSRRYDPTALGRWLEERGFELLRTSFVHDSQRRQRVVHLLARCR